MKELNRQLTREFRDGEYAHGYLEEFVGTKLAAQIQKLRTDRGWTQAELAERARMRQPRISVLESGEYDGWSFQTLLALAEAFDVGLKVCFTEFSDVVRDAARFDLFSLSVESREEDLQRFEARLTKDKSSNARNVEMVFGGAVTNKLTNVKVSSVSSSSAEPEVGAVNG